MGIIGSIRKHSGIAVTVVGLAIVIFVYICIWKSKEIYEQRIDYQLSGI